MTVRIRLFASARDAFGFDSEECSIDTPSLEAVRTFLLDKNPSGDALLRSCRFAVNMEYATANARIKEGDEVAIIPPVSGG